MKEKSCTYCVGHGKRHNGYFEYPCNHCNGTGVKRNNNLSVYSTKDLSEELEKREGVTTIHVEPYEKIEVGGIVVDGPAIVLINKD
ncbi:TPA: BC1881 family protein [Bacillus cereus]|nr:BC1881 family protein [Bacillus cereus]